MTVVTALVCSFRVFLLFPFPVQEAERGQPALRVLRSEAVPHGGLRAIRSCRCQRPVLGARGAGSQRLIFKEKCLFFLTFPLPQLAPFSPRPLLWASWQPFLSGPELQLGKASLPLSFCGLCLSQPCRDGDGRPMWGRVCGVLFQTALAFLWLQMGPENLIWGPE